MLTSLLVNFIIAQEISPSQIIGEWEFIELQDEDGVKQTIIPFNTADPNSVLEKVNRDSYVFNENGTYRSFNPYDISHGTWFIDSVTNEINLELRFSPDDPMVQRLLKSDYVELRSDGYYYQKPVKKKVLKYSPDMMIVADREKYVLIYKKK
jgi:hypothetical protein